MAFEGFLLGAEVPEAVPGGVETLFFCLFFCLQTLWETGLTCFRSDIQTLFTFASRLLLLQVAFQRPEDMWNVINWEQKQTENPVVLH